MIEESVIEELEQRGYTVRKVLKSTLGCTKLVVDDASYRYFVKCYSLKEIFRTSAEKKFVNNELTMAENFKKWDLNTCVQYLRRLYTKTTLFMFFTYYRHVTLETLLQSKKLTEHQIILIMRDLLAIIYELRGAGVLHRHLSPDKIIATGNQLKFCGFKYCTEVKRAKYDTDEYLYLIKHKTNLYCIPPEVLLNCFTGFKTQIFSFGVIVYLMIHGHYPFDSETSLKHLKNLYAGNTQKAKLDPNLGEPLSYLLQNCLQLAYTDRMSLSDVKVVAGRLYREIAKDEDDLRLQLYSVAPTIKIEDVIPSRKALQEELHGANSQNLAKLPKLAVKTARLAPALMLSKMDDHLLNLHDKMGIVNLQNANQDFSVTAMQRRTDSTHLDLVLNRGQKIQLRTVSLGLPNKSYRFNASQSSLESNLSRRLFT